MALSSYKRQGRRVRATPRAEALISASRDHRSAAHAVKGVSPGTLSTWYRHSPMKYRYSSFCSENETWKDRYSLGTGGLLEMRFAEILLFVLLECVPLLEFVETGLEHLSAVFLHEKMRLVEILQSNVTLRW